MFCGLRIELFAYKTDQEVEYTAMDFIHLENQIKQNRRKTNTREDRLPVICSGTFKELQGFINVLFGLELIVVNELNHAILVKNVSLSSRQCTKQVCRDSPLFSNLIVLIAQQCIWKFVFLSEGLKLNINIVYHFRKLNISMVGGEAQSKLRKSLVLFHHHWLMKQDETMKFFRKLSRLQNSLKHTLNLC